MMPLSCGKKANEKLLAFARAKTLATEYSKIFFIISGGIYNYIIYDNTSPDILANLYIQRPKKHFKNEQRSRDAAAKKRAIVLKHG